MISLLKSGYVLKKSSRPFMHSDGEGKKTTLNITVRGCFADRCGGKPGRETLRRKTVRHFAPWMGQARCGAVLSTRAGCVKNYSCNGDLLAFGFPSHSISTEYRRLKHRILLWSFPTIQA
jgi:hypothetical protein